jgi:arylsulfatase A-like enzyme
LVRYTSRIVIRIALFFVAAVCFAADKPNVLLILSDDHSVPHLGCYGNKDCKRLNLTPNLDALAAEGMRFNRAYTSAPQCAPSRTSIFAGRSPVGIGVTRFAQPAHPSTPFFTDVLRENGYWAGLDGRHQHLDGRNRDAEHIQATLEALRMRSLEKRFDHFVRSAGTKGTDLAKVPARVAAALDEIPAGKPFFLYFGFNQTHRAFGDDHENIDPGKLELPPDWPDLPEVRLDYAQFLDELRDLDIGVGSLLRLLRERGLERNTIVIFMGDNGEALFRGKGTLHDRGTHVPLLIRWPGVVRPGSTCDALVSGIDMAGTILQAAGLEPAPGMTSMSFLPALRGEAFSGREHVFAERGWHAGPVTRTDGLDLSRSVTTKGYRYIYNALPGRSYTPVDMPEHEAWLAVQAAHRDGKLSPLHQRLYFQNPRPVFELYDLEKDPYELENLAGREGTEAIERSLREALDKWMIREGDYLPLPTHVMANQ